MKHRTTQITALFAIMLAALVPVTAMAGTHNVGTPEELATALDCTDSDCTIKLTANIDYTSRIIVDNKNVTFDLNGYTLDVTVKTGNGALYIDNLGKVLLADPDNGALNITNTDDNGYGVYARNGGAVEVTVTDGNYGVFASGEGTSVTVYGNATGSTFGVNAERGATVNVIGNTTGGEIGAYAFVDANVTVNGDVTGSTRGVYVVSGSSVTVTGDVNVTSTSGLRYGAYVYGGGEITINGVLTVPEGSVYIRVGDTNMTKGQNVATSSKPGYLEYALDTSTVWVKTSAAAWGDIHEVRTAEELRSALASYTSRDTIKLLANIDYTSQIVINGKTLTFDLNGYTLDVTVNVPFAGALEVNNLGKVLLADPSDGEFNVTNTDPQNGDGVRAMNGGMAEVTSATGASVGVLAIGAIINVTGDVTSGNSVGVYALDGSSVTVGGNVTVTDGIGSYGALASDGSEITIDGVILMQAGGFDIRVGNTLVKMQTDGVPSASKPGYLEYTDGTSYVWVMGTATDPDVPDGYNANDWEKAETVKATIGLTDEDMDWAEIDGEWQLTSIHAADASLAGDLDLSGCTALRYLSCEWNELTSLNVSGCTALESLRCLDNSLTSLDVSGCTALQEICCERNQLDSLDASGCSELIYLSCSGNALTALDVSGCTSLRFLGCDVNQLTSLDVSGFSVLEHLNCGHNQLTTLNVSGCTALMYLICHVNQLASLDVADCTVLRELGCDWNCLTSLDVAGLAALERLLCAHNHLTSLDVSSLTVLRELGCGNNQLSALNVSGLTALETLYCYNNQLTTLLVSGCTALEYLDCSGNPLTSLDISGVTSIDDGAFADCTDLESVIIPEGVTSIGDDAFSGCTSLESVMIPKSVAYIGDGAFAGCTNLSEVYFEGNAPEVGGDDLLADMSGGLFHGNVPLIRMVAFLDATGSVIAYVYSDATGFPGEGKLWYGLTVKYRDTPGVTLVSTVPSAFVTQLGGNQNDLTITVTKQFSDGTETVVTKTFKINNNAAGTYQVGDYQVYVDTKGNTQIRECYIVASAQ